LSFRESVNRAKKFAWGCVTTQRKRGKASGILLFNVESEEELEVLLDEASKHVARGGRVPGVAIRVNPDVQRGGTRIFLPAGTNISLGLVGCRVCAVQEVR